MDGRRFVDAAVKALGSATTRRRMLRGCSPERGVVSSLTLRDSAPSKRVHTDHARGISGDVAETLGVIPFHDERDMVVTAATHHE
jgi:hypothetical protein